MTELASGGVGQDKLFWEDVAVDFNDNDKKEYGVSALTSDANLQLLKDKAINPSTEFPSLQY
jgi:hypothetical protein